MIDDTCDFCSEDSFMYDDILKLHLCKKHYQDSMEEWELED